MTKEEREEQEKLKNLLQGLHKDILKVSKAFGITYSEASELLQVYHLNDMHAIAGMWYQAHVKAKQP